MSTRVEFPNRVEWHDERGRRHRDDGPAIEWANGSREWCRNGQYHRDDGPAIEWADGSHQCLLNGVPVQDHEVGPWRFLDVTDGTI